MPSGTRTPKGKAKRSATGPARDSAKNALTYVYGIFPGDIKVDPDLVGVGDPPGKVRVVSCGDIAALVSDVPAGSSLGSPKDLATHKDLLDASAAVVPALPMRFGAVLPGDQAVTDELLSANHDIFTAALKELDGQVQYVVRARYHEKALIREVLAENQDAARMWEVIRQGGPGAGDEAKIRLGELVDMTVARKREQETDTLLARLDGLYEASVPRELRHERDAVHLALLVKSSRSEDLSRAVERLAAAWEGRVELSLLGPMAAYDFVGMPESGG